MNTRETFNGQIPARRKFHAPAALLMAVVIFLAAVTVAAWIGVAGLYISDSQPTKQVVKEISLKGSQDLAKNKVVVSLKG